MKLLHIDIETSPNLAHVWGLWQQNVGLSQIVESTEMMCFAAKWQGARRVEFFSSFHNGKADMVGAAHELLDSADAVCHYYGKRFDIPHLNREFVEAGMTPPSPYKQIDLKQQVARRFKFPSNKLQYVSTALGLEGKVQHSGHSLWVRCMAGDEKAWAQMRKYNKQDVVLLEQMYNRLLPWLTGLPNVALHTAADTDVCPKCGSCDLQRRGFETTSVGRFQRFQCQGCGGWSRSGKAAARVDVREVQL